MLDEGIYRLRYKNANPGMPDEGDGLAVLRDGKVLGSDRWGGVFAGRYDYDAANQADQVQVRLQMPPGATLVTGFTAGPAGASLDIICVFEGARTAASVVIDVAGKPVALELTRLGPIPA